MQVILSSPILVEDGTFRRETISQQEAQDWVNKNGLVNFSQHQTVLVFRSSKL